MSFVEGFEKTASLRSAEKMVMKHINKFTLGTAQVATGGVIAHKLNNQKKKKK